MVTNIFRQAKELIETKGANELLDEEIELINRALFPAINLFPRLGPCDVLTTTEVLEELAKMIEVSS